MECETKIIDAVDGKALTAQYISQFYNNNNYFNPKYPFTINNGA